MHRQLIKMTIAANGLKLLAEQFQVANEDGSDDMKKSSGLEHAMEEALAK